MKPNIKSIILAGAALMALPMFQSCLDKGEEVDLSYLMPDAIVTVKPVTDGDSKYFYFQVDDNTKFWPLDNAYHPYGEKEVRAFVKYEQADLPAEADPEVYDNAVKISWIDTILTKKPVAVAQEDAATVFEVYGNDPVDMVADWVTIAEDGYLTLRFRTKWSNPGQKHFVNLISTQNPNDPYEVEFRHNAYGDTYGQAGDGLVAFSLSSLPDTEGKTVKLTLKWHSFTGDKSVQFDYCTRQASLPAQPEVTAVRSNLNLK